MPEAPLEANASNGAKRGGRGSDGRAPIAIGARNSEGSLRTREEHLSMPQP